MSRGAFDWLPGGSVGPETPEEAAEANQAQHDAAEIRRINQAKLFFDVFVNSARGPELLELLRASTIEMPLFLVGNTLHQGMEVGLSTAEWAMFREGQNSTIRFIEEQIRIARTPTQETNDNG